MFTDPVKSPDYVKTAFMGFEYAAERSVAVLDKFYTIGGLLVRLRFAGPALLSRLTLALEHLSAPSGPDPALTVCIWDSESTGVTFPAPDHLPDEPRDTHENIVWHCGVSGVLSVLDIQKKLAVWWVADARHLPYSESGSPLLTILHWWLGTEGCQVVHAAAVGTSKGGVLLVGKGGSGKSTTAKACLGSELLYAGDDYCAVQISPQPCIHSLYSSSKVCASDVPRYPHLEGALSNRSHLSEEKALYFLARHLPDALSQGFPLRAVLLPQVTGLTETRTVRISPAGSLLALAPSTLFQLPGAGIADFERLSALVRSVPSYILELGTDLKTIPGAILRVLAGGG